MFQQAVEVVVVVDGDGIVDGGVVIVLGDTAHFVVAIVTVYTEVR